MTRTVLYYPTISIPNGPWLRRALFYFDRIASIVPRSITWQGELGPLHLPVTPEVEFLLERSIFRAVSPEELHVNRTWDDAQRFTDEFLEAIKRASYRLEPRGKTVKIHKGKLGGSVLSRLQETGLIEDERPPEHPDWSEWYLVEERTARLYMAMLAQFIADVDDDAMVPGTDRIEDEDLVYRSKSDDGIPCIETRFQRVLPTPSEKASLADILEFKDTHQPELIAYRKRIDDLQTTLSNCESRSDMKLVLVQFEEEQRKETIHLAKEMSESKVGLIWGSMKTLIKASQPALFTAAVAAIPGAHLASFAFPALLGGASIEVGSYITEKRNEKRTASRSQPFAYVQKAFQKGLL